MQSAHSELCEHLPSQELRRAIEIGMKVQKDIADNLPCHFGDHTRARSAQSELCEHCYLARSEGGQVKSQFKPLECFYMVS